MKEIKILFLDIDGVMNKFEKILLSPREATPNTMKSLGLTLEVHKELVDRVNQITDATGAYIVISSSWRIGYLADWVDVVLYLHNSGLKGFILGRTPSFRELRTRGEEIKAYLSDHKEENIVSFIILDDNNDMGQYSERLILTDHQIGIQDEHVEQAIRMLNE